MKTCSNPWITIRNDNPVLMNYYGKIRNSVVVYFTITMCIVCHMTRYWPFVRGTHRSPVNSPQKGQWRGALMFSLIWVWINDWVNNRKPGDLRHYPGNYDVTVMHEYLANACLHPLPQTHRTGAWLSNILNTESTWPDWVWINCAVVKDQARITNYIWLLYVTVITCTHPNPFAVLSILC